MRWFPGTMTLTWVTVTLELATSRGSARRPRYRTHTDAWGALARPKPLVTTGLGSADRYHRGRSLAA